MEAIGVIGMIIAIVALIYLTFKGMNGFVASLAATVNCDFDCYEWIAILGYNGQHICGLNGKNIWLLFIYVLCSIGV